MILSTSLLEFLETLRKRPKLYLGETSLLALKYFMNGYMAKEKRLGVQPKPGVDLHDFQKYIENLHGIKDAPKDCFTLIYALSEDKDNALNLFFELLDNFLENQQ